MKRNFVLLGATLLVAIGCDRRERFAAPDSTSTPSAPAVAERTAYLSISDLSPDSGATVVVAGNLSVGGDLSLGSYRVRLAYDAKKIHFLDEIPTGGMLRVVNPQPTEVIVVGASSDASTDGRLFTLRFRVDDPAGISSLVLKIDELNDSEYKDRERTITRSSALILDRTLSGKVTPK